MGSFKEKNPLSARCVGYALRFRLLFNWWYITVTSTDDRRRRGYISTIIHLIFSPIVSIQVSEKGLAWISLNWPSSSGEWLEKNHITSVAMDMQPPLFAKSNHHRTEHLQRCQQSRLTKLFMGISNMTAVDASCTSFETSSLLNPFTSVFWGPPWKADYHWEFSP